MEPAIVTRPDGRPRCWWAVGERPDPLMAAYHDEEWGVPVHDDRELFERLMLEGFQAGLSWSTILHKRDGFHDAFDGWRPSAVAAYGEPDRARLLADARIVRNRAKVDAAIGNARAFLRLVEAEGSFDTYLAVRCPGPAPSLAADATAADIPVSTPAAAALSRDLAGRGFRFVGPTIVYAFMQSIGLADDHLPGCFRYRG
jgi:DNA-3-methyladenine glycosylase I